ncbi:hypothetical protein L596_022467 [Steinernema carpocapsae]|uniref:Uncharacterized protein n=1 Tax=Steinernema carpocapsae TaxID=34508 RepID=A0A4U5MLU6_STECR|nr:hypothetical protein L596_022467 [Steinernema carpocapsae]
MSRECQINDKLWTGSGAGAEHTEDCFLFELKVFSQDGVFLGPRTVLTANIECGILEGVVDQQQKHC